MSHQGNRAGKLREAFLQRLKRRNIEVVGGFVQYEEIGGAEHELSDQHPCLLAAGKKGDLPAQLFAAETKSFRPGGNMHVASPVTDGVSLGAKSVPEGQIFLQLTSALVEPDDAQAVRAFDRAGVGFHSPGQNAQQGCFAAAVCADESETPLRGQHHIQIAEKGAVSKRLADPFRHKKLFGSTSRRRKIELGDTRITLPVAELQFGEFANHPARLIDSTLGLGASCFGAAPQPGYLALYLTFHRILLLQLRGKV